MAGLQKELQQERTSKPIATLEKLQLTLVRLKNKFQMISNQQQRL